ncbi:hypothetical protein ACTFIV_010457 [Dictyostelium citrinum]
MFESLDTCSYSPRQLSLKIGTSSGRGGFLGRAGTYGAFQRGRNSHDWYSSILATSQKLFNTDENKLEPKFEQKVIETELLNLVETEKFITLKKIKHDEAILKNTNQDLHKYKFNKITK